MMLLRLRCRRQPGKFCGEAAPRYPYLDLVRVRQSSTLWLSQISVWEVLLLCEKGRLSLEADANDWIAGSVKALALREAPLNHPIAILSRQVELLHQDPADRLIAATALHYDLRQSILV